MPLLRVDDLELSYGGHAALRGVSLSLEAGSIGLLGPNGAGKSSLLKVLLGMVTPQRGSVTLLGLDAGRQAFSLRQRVGYMPERGGLIPELSAQQYVALAGELCGLPGDEANARAHRVLQLLGLGEARYRRLGSFSSGMVQRARLAQALVGDPDLLLLDEPTTGLDPQGREEMLALIGDLPARTGISILLSTHILPDVERVCDQVVLLDRGRVRYAGPLATLLSEDAGVYEVHLRDPSPTFVESLQLSRCVVHDEGMRLRVRLPDAASAEPLGARDILEIALETGAQIRKIAPMLRALDDVFVEAVETGRHGDE